MTLGLTGGLVVALILLQAAPLDARQASTAASGVDQEVGLDPGQWTARVLRPCHADHAAQLAADDAVASQIGSGASREEASFVAREALARRVSRDNARRASLARLTTLVFAFKARVRLTGEAGSTSMGRVVEDLLAAADPCAIDALEATLLAGLLGLAFTDATAERLHADGPFAMLDSRFRETTAAGATAEAVFERWRPERDDLALAYVAAVFREAATRAVDLDAAGAAEHERRLQAVLQFLPLVLEPLRVRFYLHGTIDAVEGTFGLPVPDLVNEQLFQNVEGQLFASVAAMRRLRDAQPSDTLRAVAPLRDRWFRRVVLPGLARAIDGDPHAAYAFFVTSGGVVAPGPVASAYGVTTRAPAYALEDLRRATMDEALGLVARNRVPARFHDVFARVEAQATEITMTPEAVAAALDARREPPRLKARVRAMLLDPDRSGALSTLDAFRPGIADASRTPGRLNDAALVAAADLMVGLKARAVQRLVDAELGPTPDPGLAAYVRTAAALMLEREQRQVSDGMFRQSTRGAAVGFLLRRFMGGTLPVSLAVPGGVSGIEFAELVDTLTPKNAASGRDYRGRAAHRVALVHDGREYHDALVEVIDSARHFLNISAFDWKTDTGGREIAYRLMAKTLGLDGMRFPEFVALFADGLPMDEGGGPRLALYDLPTTRIKDLLVWHVFMTASHPDVVAAREGALEAGATLLCTAVRTCGSLDGLVIDDPSGGDRARRAFRAIDALFSARSPALADVRPRRALRDYVDDPDGLRRFVRRFGLKRADRPDTPFPITIVADGKQNVFNVRWGERSPMFPFVVTEPVRDLYFVLAEFDIRVVLWKAPIEFPWNAGPVPWPGRLVAGHLPMPFVPYPWIAAVPGFGWAGVTTSLALQWLIASDVRMWWASVNHTKSWSSESRALESGMGMASKYFNAYETHKTWHDMGVLVEGPIVDDVNDHFVQVFNQARVNNGGLAASRGTPVGPLRYDDFCTDTPAPDGSTARTWLLTTHPENGDANYRGVFAAALAAARHNIYIENSFFSDPLIARMLMHKAREFRARVTCDGLDAHGCSAKRREAVPIYLILPDTSDKPIVDAVGAADFFEMLHLGIKVHRWNPRRGWSASRMLHSKVWLIDYRPEGGGVAYVGAANATQRSHLADNEAGILSSDAAFVRDVYERIFVRDLTRDSRRESGENFRVVRASNPVVAGSRWLRRLLVELLWLI